jgi:hypothetical protein
MESNAFLNVLFRHPEGIDRFMASSATQEQGLENEDENNEDDLVSNEEYDFENI